MFLATPVGVPLVLQPLQTRVVIREIASELNTAVPAVAANGECHHGTIGGRCTGGEIIVGWASLRHTRRALASTLSHGYRGVRACSHFAHGPAGTVRHRKGLDGCPGAWLEFRSSQDGTRQCTTARRATNLKSGRAVKASGVRIPSVRPFAHR